MSTINDGGPAFPVPNDANVNRQEGMTLRDYFAAKAMGCISHSLIARDLIMSFDEFSGECYKAADAMIRARNQPRATPIGQAEKETT